MKMIGKQQLRHSRESGNPGGITANSCVFSLDARPTPSRGQALRGHDELWLLKISVVNS